MCKLCPAFVALVRAAENTEQYILPALIFEDRITESQQTTIEETSHDYS